MMFVPLGCSVLSTSIVRGGGGGGGSLSGLSFLMSHCSVFLLAAVVVFLLNAAIPPVRRTLSEPSVGLAEGPVFKCGFVQVLLCFFHYYFAVFQDDSQLSVRFIEQQNHVPL